MRMAVNVEIKVVEKLLPDSLGSLVDKFNDSSSDSWQNESRLTFISVLKTILIIINEINTFFYI